jgi:hypothetical protein
MPTNGYEAARGVRFLTAIRFFMWQRGASIALLIVATANIGIAREVKLAAEDDNYFMCQSDRAISIVDRRTCQATRVADADDFCVNLPRQLAMTAARLPDSKSRLSIYQLQNGAPTLLAETEIDGTAFDVIPANSVTSDFSIKLIHGHNRGDKSWAEVFYARPTDAALDTKRPLGVILDPVPVLSSMMTMAGWGEGMFSEDQEGWYAGTVFVSGTALQLYPELRQPTENLALEFPMAFVITNAKSLQQGWPALPHTMETATGNLKCFRRVLAFRKGKEPLNNCSNCLAT